MQTIDFIHPEDAAALEALKKIPVLPKVTKAFMDLGAEQLQTGLNMASKVRLSLTQLPHIYNKLSSICVFRSGIRSSRYNQLTFLY